ncbi:MAG: general secretion pathway protein GspK [Phycisphaerae bacterium]|nr:general secretion pathway protein GspK [Phycisphaerae bacterium]
MTQRKPNLRFAIATPFRPRRRGMILLVVLVIVSLLAILGTTFAYSMRADLSAVTAEGNRLQAMLAAEAGIQRAFLLLRAERTDFDAWYDNREAFRRIIVWAPGQIGGQTSLNQEVEEGTPAWRFSIVAPEINAQQLGGDTDEFRYGLVDEAGKLNLNTATRAQLVSLFEQFPVEGVIPDELADAVLDWRDADDDTRTYGAELPYYQSRVPAYRPKNGAIETVEELLLIKGFNGRILYGEDFNRNGHLDWNEDDGEDEGVFPPDNGDGVLDRGIYPYVTVYSRDMNSANDNRPRINISKGLDIEKLPDEIREIVEEEIRPEVFDFINEAVGKGHQFKSVAELLVDAKILAKPSQENNNQNRGNSRDRGRNTNRGGERNSNQETDRKNSEEGLDDESALEEAPTEEDLTGQPNKNRRRQQSVREEEAPSLDDLREKRPDLDESAFEEDTRGTEADTSGAMEGVMEEGDPTLTETETGEETEPDEEDIVEIIPSPVEPADMPAIMDRLTTDLNPAQYGLINVNTAGRPVLMTLPGITEQEVDSIISTRLNVDAETKATPAWLAIQGVVSNETFARIGPHLTARSLQFTVESFGFADHEGTYRRLQVIVEMRGQVEQILYWRDITPLGLSYPLRDKEDEWKDEVTLRHR